MIAYPIARSFLTVERQLDMKLKGTPAPGYRIDKKTGKPVRAQKLDTSAKIRQRKSKKVRPVRRTAG